MWFFGIKKCSICYRRVNKKHELLFDSYGRSCGFLSCPNPSSIGAYICRRTDAEELKQLAINNRKPDVTGKPIAKVESDMDDQYQSTNFGGDYGN